MKAGLIRKIVRHLGMKPAYLLSTAFSEPELIYLKITGRCNFHCEHCDIWRTQASDDLSLEDWKSIIKKIKTNFSELSVTLSGGEPLLYKDFWPLIEILKSENVQVNLNTNGSLINDENLERLLAAPFKKIEVSLYSLTPETHDSFRNTANAFEKADEAIRTLAQKKSQIGSKTEILVAFLLNEKNIAEAPEFIKHFSEMGVAVSIQALDTNITEMINRTEFNEKTLISANALWPKDQNQINEIFDELINLKRSGKLIYNRLDALRLMRQYYLGRFDEIKQLPCYAGQNNLIISAQGDAFFCFSGPTIGNLLTDSFENIWQGNRAKEIRKSIKHCPELCRVMNCNFQSSLSRKLIEKFKKMI